MSNFCLNFLSGVILKYAVDSVCSWLFFMPYSIGCFYWVKGKLEINNFGSMRILSLSFRGMTAIKVIRFFLKINMLF